MNDRQPARIGVLLLACAGLLLASACEPKVALLTDLQAGRTLQVEFPWMTQGGGGQLSGTASDGEVFRGSFAAIPGEPSGKEMLLKVFSAVAWDQGHDQLAMNLDNINHREEYTVTLAGDKGTVLDLVLAVNLQTGHGSGSGKDNRGSTWRIQM